MAVPVNVKVVTSVIELPVAPGFCEAQLGGVFFVTVHVCVTLPTALVSVATSVFEPVTMLLDNTF